MVIRNIRFDLTIEVFAIILRYLATIVCRCYLISDSSSDTLNSYIRNDLKKLSEGKWNRLLRDCLDHYRKKCGKTKTKLLLAL